MFSSELHNEKDFAIFFANVSIKIAERRWKPKESQ